MQSDNAPIVPDYNELINGLVQENGQLRWELSVARNIIIQYEARSAESTPVYDDEELTE